MSSVSISNPKVNSEYETIEESVEWAVKNLNILTGLGPWQTLRWEEESKEFSVYRPGIWYKVNSDFNSDCINDFFKNVDVMIRQGCEVPDDSKYKQNIMSKVNSIRDEVNPALNALNGLAETYRYYRYLEIAKRIEEVKEKWENNFPGSSNPRSVEFLSQLNGCFGEKSSKPRRNARRPVMNELKREFSEGAGSSRLKKVSVEKDLLSQIKSGQLSKLKPASERQLAPKANGPASELEELLSRMRPMLRLNCASGEASDSEGQEFQE